MAESDKAETKFQKQLISAFDTAAVGGKLSSLIKDSITEVMNEQSKRISELVGTVNLLRDELKNRDRTIDDLLTRNTQMIADNAKLSTKIVELENYLRRDNLVFSGLEVNFANVASTDETPSNLVNQVISLCNTQLNCAVFDSDISTAHLLPKGNGENVRRQVIVRFTRRCVRDLVYKARTRLKDYNHVHDKKIYVNEDLSSATRSLFKDARQLFKNKLINGCWTRSGKVMVKTIRDAVVEIKKPADLEQFAPR